MNYKDEILNIRKQRRVSVAKLATITGIPVDRIYKWESGAGNPKAEDAEKLKNWLNNVEEIQEPASDSTHQGDHWYKAKIDDLLRINEKHADNYGRLSEAYLVLVGKINSPTPEITSSPEPPGGKGIRPPYKDHRLSGKRKQSGIDQE